MSTFAMNLVAPDSPMPFIALGGEVVYWLNPNGTVTVGGPWVGILLPVGVVDTGALGGLTPTGDILLYRPDLDTYFDTNMTILNPDTGLPLASGGRPDPNKPSSELGPLDFIRAGLDGYFTALEQFAAKANASLPDAGKINIDVFKQMTLLTKTGPLAFADAMVNYQSDGASGIAKSVLGTMAGVAATAIAASRIRAANSRCAQSAAARAGGTDARAH